jgi:FkbM family methyltransferase
MFRYFQYFDYYLEVFAKRLSGRGNGNPHKNGEFLVLEKIVNNAQGSVCMVDGGANIGDHSMHFLSLCADADKSPLLYAVEPFPTTREALENRIGSSAESVIGAALGDEMRKVSFYYDDADGTSGANSLLPHYYLSNKLEVDQITLDNLIADKKIEKINFLKLDIEGAELHALMGALHALERQLIDYIQLEYNQTWIEGGATIEKILNLCNKYGYQLYRLGPKQLFAIPMYHFLLDDFHYSNLLLVKEGCPLPLPCRRNALPNI